MVYVALLRGINVGSHKVKMVSLREVFEKLGFNNVQSYINSGNIFFNTESTNKQTLTPKIEDALRQELGYEVPVFLRTLKEVEAIINQRPFKDVGLTPDLRFCVTFTTKPIRTDLNFPILSSKNDIELIGVNKYEVFVVWHIIKGRPPSGKFIGEPIPKNNTTRFNHTLIKILAAAKS